MGLRPSSLTRGPSVRYGVYTPNAGELSVEGGDKPLGLIPSDVDDGGIDETQSGFCLPLKCLDRIHEELGARKEIEFACAEQHVRNLGGHPRSAAGHENGHHFEEDIFEQQTPTLGAIEKVSHGGGRDLMVRISAVVVSDEETRIEDDHRS